MSRGSSSLLLAVLASALVACGGPAPAAPPAQGSPSERRPAAAPTATPSSAPTPAPQPTPTPQPAALQVHLVGPSGSSLEVGDARIALPGSLEFELERKSSRPVQGRLNLNALSQALKIPSSARAHLEGDGRGIWVRVKGSCQVAAGPASEPIRLRVGEDELLKILWGKGVTLSDPQFRVQISLELLR